MAEEQKAGKPGDDDDQGKEECLKDPVYIVPSHPAGAPPLSKETAIPEEPVTAQDSLPELIQQAMEELRTELKAELQAEMQAELQKELKGGSELNVKG